MITTPKDSEKDSPNKFMALTFNLLAFIAVAVGLILMSANFLGGAFIAIFGALYFKKFRTFLVGTKIGGSINNHRNIKIVGGILLVSGILLSAGSINGDNLEYWNKHKQEIASQVEADIQSNKLNEAKNNIDKFKPVVKNDPLFDGLVSKYQLAKDKLDAEELAKKAAYREQVSKEMEEKKAIEKAKAAAEAQRQALNAKSNPSGSGSASRVVSKIGSLIYLADGNSFAIFGSTVLHINGQIYPKGDPDYIQVGYQCRFTGDKLSPAEVFCER